MRLSILFDLCDERDMGFEVDVEEEGDFPFGRTLLWHEETPLKRLRAGASDSGEHIGPIVGTKRANDDGTVVAKTFLGRIMGGFEAR